MILSQQRQLQQYLNKFYRSFIKRRMSEQQPMLSHLNKEPKLFNLAIHHKIISRSPPSKYPTMKTIKEESQSQIMTHHYIDPSEPLKLHLPKCLSQQRTYNIFKTSDLYAESVRESYKLRNRINLLNQNLGYSNYSMKSSLLDQQNFSIVGKKECLAYEQKNKKNKHNTYSHNRHKLSQSYLSFSKVSTSNIKFKPNLQTITKQELYELYNIGTPKQGTISPNIFEHPDSSLSNSIISNQLKMESSVRKINIKHHVYDSRWNKQRVTSTKNNQMFTEKKVIKEQNTLKQQKQNILSKQWPTNLRNSHKLVDTFKDKYVERVLMGEKNVMKVKGCKKLKNEAEWIEKKSRNEAIVLQPIDDFKDIVQKFKTSRKNTSRVNTQIFENEKNQNENKERTTTKIRGDSSPKNKDDKHHSLALSLSANRKLL